MNEMWRGVHQVVGIAVRSALIGIAAGVVVMVVTGQLQWASIAAGAVAVIASLIATSALFSHDS